MNKFTLDKDDAALLIIDVQEKLAAAMPMRETVVANCLHLLELAMLFDMPVLVTEQYPRGLGPTVPELRTALSGLYQPVEKLSFNCCREAAFMQRLKQTGRKKIIVAGMETHICVLQTGLGMMDAGCCVHVVEDAVCSRSKQNWKTGINFMRDAGAVITCTETVLFQLLGEAGTEEFKIISQRIK